MSFVRVDHAEVGALTRCREAVKCWFHPHGYPVDYQPAFAFSAFPYPASRGRSLRAAFPE